MDENKNHINNRLSEQLPSHSPDPEMWQRLSGKLDMLDAEIAYQEKLQGLPVHSPDQGTWNLISRRLTRIAYYKTGVRIALSVAAGLLLFFTVSRMSDQYQTSTDKVPQFASEEQPAQPSAKQNQANPSVLQENEIKNPDRASGDISSARISIAQSKVIPVSQKVVAKTKTPLTVNEIDAIPIENKKLEVPVDISETIPSGNEIAVNSTIPVQPENAIDPSAQNKPVYDLNFSDKEKIKTEIETQSIMFQKEPYKITASPSVKFNAPIEPLADKKANNFALAMGYFPENINNGTDNSLFHNVDFTASYNKDKVRFNTSLGMAYNEEQIEFDMYYDINTPVTALGPGGKVDTLSYEVANLESEYMGTEKHKYVTYNLGFGRKLFSIGKFSTWINAGAGFGIKLNEPDLIASTANSIKGQYNASIVRVSSTKPVYNDVNINFVTGIDFNYKVLSRLSISFAPVSRWYFKPVLSMDNQPTDELTLGFRTGMKFDF